MVFTVPDHWRVFVLDDTQERLDWFRERIPTMTSAKTAGGAIARLAADRFDLIFLDHDLSWLDAADVNRPHGNGKEVARFLAAKRFAGRVVIHSKNEEAVRIMRKILPEATTARFGDFDITVQPAPASAAR